MTRLRTEWDNNKSLEFIKIRCTGVLGKYLARYLSALGTTYHLPLTIDTELYVISLSAHDSIDQSFFFVVNWQ
jgi:hypothetical protein